MTRRAFLVRLAWVLALVGALPALLAFLIGGSTWLGFPIGALYAMVILAVTVGAAAGLFLSAVVATLMPRYAYFTIVGLALPAAIGACAVFAGTGTVEFMVAAALVQLWAPVGIAGAALYGYSPARALPLAVGAAGLSGGLLGYLGAPLWWLVPVVILAMTALLTSRLPDGAPLPWRSLGGAWLLALSIGGLILSGGFPARALRLGSLVDRSLSVIRAPYPDLPVSAETARVYRTRRIREFGATNDEEDLRVVEFAVPGWRYLVAWHPDGRPEIVGVAEREVARVISRWLQDNGLAFQPLDLKYVDPIRDFWLVSVFEPSGQSLAHVTVQQGRVTEVTWYERTVLEPVAAQINDYLGRGGYGITIAAADIDKELVRGGGVVVYEFYYGPRNAGRPRASAEFRGGAIERVTGLKAPGA